jgi:hypothetical protein
MIFVSNERYGRASGRFGGAVGNIGELGGNLGPPRTGSSASSVPFKIKTLKLMPSMKVPCSDLRANGTEPQTLMPPSSTVEVPV